MSGPLSNDEHLFARLLANPNELDNLISSLLALCCLLGTLNGPVDHHLVTSPAPLRYVYIYHVHIVYNVYLRLTDRCILYTLL